MSAQEKSHIVTCNDGYTVHVFDDSGGKKVPGFSYTTDESIKLATGACIFFTAILWF